MDDLKFNPSTYTIIDNVSGEVLSAEVFLEKVPKGYWEKTYAKTLADFMGLAGNKSTDVLAWIIKNKDHKNLVVGTLDEIAADCGTSKVTVSKIFQKLYKHQFLKKIKNSRYLLHPRVMSHGSQVKAAIIMRVWDEN